MLSAANYIKDINTSSTKPPLELNDGLSKLGLIFLTKQATDGVIVLQQFRTLYDVDHICSLTGFN